MVFVVIWKEDKIDKFWRILNIWRYNLKEMGSKRIKKVVIFRNWKYIGVLIYRRI